MIAHPAPSYFKRWWIAPLRTCCAWAPASDVIDAVERLEAQRELVVISTAVGWSIRLATVDESQSDLERASSESPWPLIRQQLDAMRAIADDRYSLEFAEQRKTDNI